MPLLVVSNYQDINEKIIPWDVVDGVMLVKTSYGVIYDLRNKLYTLTDARDIPLYICYAIPPINTKPPDELLRGFGLTVSGDVILYGECTGSLQCIEVEKG